MSEMHPPSPFQPPTPPANPAAPPPAGAARMGTTPWASPPRVESTQGLATAALVAAGLVLLLSLATTLASFDAARRFEEAERAGQSAFDTFTVHDALGLPLFGAQLLAWILTAVWLGRARANLTSIRPGFHFTRSDVWDWLAWIVPIVSLWFPYQVVRDLSRGSSRTFTQSTWLGLWWGTWLAGLFLSQSSARVSVGSGDTFSLLPILDGLSTLALAVAFAVWVPIVRSIVRDQDAAATTA